jgi:hypothetical protein
MFKHILFSAVAVSSLAITTPVLAGEGPPFPPSDEDSNSQQRDITAEQRTSEKMSVDAPREGERVPAAYQDITLRTGQEEDRFDRSLDAGG